jgi:hypothetical protein
MVVGPGTRVNPDSVADRPFPAGIGSGMPGIPDGAGADAAVEVLAALVPLFLVGPELQPAMSRAAVPAATVTYKTRRQLLLAGPTGAAYLPTPRGYTSNVKKNPWRGGGPALRVPSPTRLARTL